MRLAADQTLPLVLSRRAVPPIVYDVALDTDFGAIDSEHGPVSFALTASSRPNIRAGTVEHVPRGRFQPRAFADEQEQLSKREYLAQGIHGRSALSPALSRIETDSQSSQPAMTRIRSI